MHRDVISLHVNGSHSLCPWSWLVVVSDQGGKFISRDRSSARSLGIGASQEGVHTNH